MRETPVTIADLARRITFALAVLTGRLPIPATVIEMELNIMLDNLKALVATGQAAAQRLIDKGTADASARADLEAQVANFETDAIAAVQPLVDQVTQAAPEAPAPALDQPQ